jgi:hypothetical protein
MVLVMAESLPAEEGQAKNGKLRKVGRLEKFVIDYMQAAS